MVTYEKNKNIFYTFWGVVYTYFIIMMGTTLPTPLYPIYSDLYKLIPFDITVIYAVYAVGVISALLLFGHISDKIGRKKVLIAGLTLSLLSDIFFLLSQNIIFLFIGRILSGFSAGLFTSTATATLINMLPVRKQEFASMIASSVNSIGLGFGPLFAGLIAEYITVPLRSTFILHALLIIPALMIIVRMEEPIKTLEKFKIKFQKLHIPKHIRRTFIQAIIPTFVGFSILGLFTSIAPTFLQDILTFENKLIIGFIVFLAFLSSSLGQLILQRVSYQTVLLIGCLTLFSGVIFIILALYYKYVGLLVISAILSGAGHGFIFRAGLQSIISITSSEKHAEVTSSFFTIAYIALSIPVIGVGVMAIYIGIQNAGIIFSFIMCLIIIFSMSLLIKHMTSQKN